MAQTPRPVDAGITVGQVFLGKYKVESILGHGGMGIVAKCIHLGLNEPVAIKMLRQDVLLDRDAVERFTREAQAARKLKSEHVARVEDVGTSDEGVPYMVMEFLDGEDLGQMVDDRGTIQAPFASMLMLQAAEALCEAHTNSIVHRDVKPSNLFVTWRPDGSALLKVLDFGISKSPTGTDMKLTQTQSLLGTPAYMSPEQMRSARLVDMRTDIWSLGTVFYELLEGRRPFEAESFSEMCVKVAVDPPTPMVNAPPAIQAIILRCLAKSPDQRYANMAELARDLLPHVQDVHQATLLVDRMQRMFGRRSVAPGDQWDVSTGTSRVPGAVRDIASAPIAAPWGATSDPFAAPSPTPAPWSGETRAPTATLKEDSRPARALSEVSTRPARRSKLPLVLLGLGVAGAVIGVVVGLKVAGGGDDSKTDSATELAIAPHIPAPEPKSPDDGKDRAAIAADDGKAKPEVPQKVDEPKPVTLDDADEAMIAAFEAQAKLADKLDCKKWDDEARLQWPDGGVAGAKKQLQSFDDARKRRFETSPIKERFSEPLKAVLAAQDKCDQKKIASKLPKPPRTGANVGAKPIVCPAGHHKVGTGCQPDLTVKPPVVEPPKPPDSSGRSPNGKCGVLDRLPSGGWPERCLK